MASNVWKFFGVTYGRSSTKGENVKLLELTDPATNKLASMFAKESGAFLSREQVSYVDNPVYKPDKEDEVLVIYDYELPEKLLEAAKEWHYLDPLEPEDMTPENIKVIMGIRYDGDEQYLIAFKKLNRSRILDREATWLHWDENTFDTVDGPGFVLPEGLCGVYTSGRLCFDSDRDVNAFLDLADYFRQATKNEIDALLDEGPIKWRSERDFHKIASKRCKRLMYVFMLSGGFTEEITLDGVIQVASEVGLSLTSEIVNEERVLILPENSTGITSVYEILTHHYSPGIWDGLWRRYNSSQIVPGQAT